MNTLIRPAVSIFVLLSLLTGALYPLAVTGIARVLFPEQARGSLIFEEGRPVGSTLIGQSFTDPNDFWGRPSATAGGPYNGAASGGSNLGPLNPTLVEAVQGRIAALKAANPDHHLPIPGDLVQASASGLDPHISPAAAAYQVARVASRRGLDPKQVEALVQAHTQGSDFGLFGAPRVNVLALNRALDLLAPVEPSTP
ncbi:potassium-transporting ATPase subunit C [Thiocystis minor]|uniref:potassium-transporting ATPase subunit KdpC n=1 Tax=Thiocystis minor TaxID=61597 RepID=UPI00191215C7|nr:potassium-transporting ATPase subunit KdpC [Thiocystis minor]MBK5964981.1 potassium-transporting ATPase subunit C [Thiocystis minor]